MLREIPETLVHLVFPVNLAQKVLLVRLVLMAFVVFPDLLVSLVCLVNRVSWVNLVHSVLLD